MNQAALCGEGFGITGGIEFFDYSVTFQRTYDQLIDKLST